MIPTKTRTLLTLGFLGALATGCGTTRASLATDSSPPLPMLEVSDSSELAGSAAGNQPSASATPHTDNLPVVDELALAEGSEWQFQVSPYLWAVGVDGDAVLDGTEVPLDIEFADVLDDFNGGGSVYFEGHKNRWGFGVDITYITLEGEEDVMPGVSAKTDTAIGLYAAEGSYQLGPDSPWDVIVGLRVLDIDQDIDISGGPELSGGITSTQGVIGGRGRWNFNDKWMVNVRADVGFSDSDSSWQILALAGYQFSRSWSVDFGYRVMGMDVEDGSAELDATLQGLMLGVIFGW